MNFGDKVTAKSVLRRKCEHRPQPRSWNKEATQPYKFWARIQMHPRVGILIGFRNLSNGFKYWEDEAGWVFNRKENFRAALVVFSDKENPEYVPMDDLGPVPQ